MGNASTIIGLGIFVALASFLGVPGVIKTVLFVLSGLSIAFIGYLIRRREASRFLHTHKNDVFVENGHDATEAEYEG